MYLKVLQKIIFFVILFMWIYTWTNILSQDYTFVNLVIIFLQLFKFLCASLILEVET